MTYVLGPLKLEGKVKLERKDVLARTSSKNVRKTKRNLKGLIRPWPCPLRSLNSHLVLTIAKNGRQRKEKKRKGKVYFVFLDWLVGWLVGWLVVFLPYARGWKVGI
jgi:hypothetical protein